MSGISRFKSAHGASFPLVRPGGLFRGLFQLQDLMFPKNSPPAICELSEACSSCQIGPFHGLFPLTDGCFLRHIPTVMEAQMGPY